MRKEEEANVISLFEARKKSAPIIETELGSQAREESFAEIMRRNAENKARLEKERVKANKGVIRSYRLKK